MKTLVLSSLLFAPILSFAAVPAGLWQLRGINSQHGSYTGQIEFRPYNGGTLVTRVITYDDYKFQNLKVQEVWQGDADAQGNPKFSLKNSDFMVSAEGFTRDPKLYNTTTDFSVSYEAKGDEYQAQFNTPTGGSFYEKINSPQPLGAQAPYQNQRQLLDAKGDKGVPAVIRLGMKIAKKRIKFDEHPTIKKFQDRPEFKNENPIVVFDPTDFDFYRRNHDVVRVANKPIDTISLSESLMRRNAYASTLDQKADGFGVDMQKYRLNEYGIVSYASFDGNGQMTGQHNDYDACLWTGMYVATEAMRYQVTKDPKAIENMKRSLRGIFILLNITGDKKQFARSIMPYKGNENLGDRWHRGTGEYSDITWLDGGNNDMVRGITHALLWAHIVIPENDPFRAQMVQATKRLLELNILEEKEGNKPAAYGIAALILKDPVYKTHFRKMYSDKDIAFGGYLFNTTFYWNGIGDWSGVNLNILNFINEITLADMLGENKIRDRLRERLMDAWVTYSPTRHSYYTLAAYKYAFSKGTRGDQFRKRFSDTYFMSAVDFSSWTLREFPYPRPQMDLAYDHTISNEWCVNPLPGMFWKAANKKIGATEWFFESLYTYPAFESAGISSNFMWKDLYFGYQGSSSRGSSNNAVDYLYVYWLARSAGLKLN